MSPSMSFRPRRRAPPSGAGCPALTLSTHTTADRAATDRVKTCRRAAERRPMRTRKALSRCTAALLLPRDVLGQPTQAIRPRAREAAAPPAGGLDARRRAPCGRSRCVFPDPTGRGPQRIGSRQHRRPERVRRAVAPLAERTRAMEGSTRQPSDLESTAGRRAWDPDGFDGPPHPDTMWPACGWCAEATR